MRDFREMLADQQDAKMKLREVSQEMADYASRFDGTLKEALQMGIVRLNFTSPSGFAEWLRNN